MTEKEEYYSAEVFREAVEVNFPDSNSPYVPEWITVDKKGIKVYGQDVDGMMYEKKLEWKDFFIMHKALTKIFGRKKYK